MTRPTRAAACATAALAGLLLSLSTVSAAHAASSPGGPITRSEVLDRAQSWVDAGVPYSQTDFYTDGYREDCSGFVSMAWHLKSSLTTATLPSVASQIGFGQLEGGDILDYTGAHTFLFDKWTNQANGDFTYYAESNPDRPTHGPTAANINNSSIEGWPTSYYDAYRYDNITDDTAPPPHSPVSSDALPDGTMHVQTLVGGRVFDNARNTNGTWSGAKLLDGNGSVTAVSSAALPDGSM
ncbi:hypothetical protein ACLMNJ_28420, partial [Streptomyces seoulensis]